ncbi:MAG: alpha-glucosidase C-terminal domain-containing protein, partial [Ignavibacteriales bacterium]|nr:alpha-glucosidase C-terminal domain-containing protein [Ignavibacteriales bacterium]
KEREELRQGSFDILTADNGRGFLAFSRTMKEQSAIVAFNVSSDTFTTALPISFDSTVVKDALSGRQYMVHKHTIDLTLAPRSGTVLLCS